jgi:hypothetical protein
MNTVFILLLLGHMEIKMMPHDQGVHHPIRETYAFKFFDKDLCEKAADAMYRAQTIIEAVCIEYNE